MTDRYEEIRKALAHEIWAAAQLAPGEGIEDAVERVAALLATTEIELLPLPKWMSNYTIPADSSVYDKDVMLADRMHDYARANVASAIAPLQAEIEALRAEVERLNRILERIVEGDGDSTVAIRAGADAFAAAREYLLREREVSDAMMSSRSSTPD